MPPHSVMIQIFIWTRTRAFRITMLAGALLVSGLVFSRHIVAGGRPTPAIDRRLILHPQTFTAHGVVSGHGPFTLQLYPAIPGKQQLQLVLPPYTRVGAVKLAFSMPGMAMPAVRIRLVAHRGTYRGTVTLPMFGRYLVEVTIGPYPPFALHVLLTTSFG